MQVMALVSGIPAAGKSEYGRWLQRERGFIHLDLENGGMNGPRLRAAWEECVRSGSPLGLVEAMQELGGPVLLDWGFPPQFLRLVQSLNDAGVTAWWFDGDRDAARANFIQRGTVAVEAPDTQMREISRAWAEIEAFYDHRIINVISASGSYLPPEQISALMFAPDLLVASD